MTSTLVIFTPEVAESVRIAEAVEVGIVPRPRNFKFSNSESLLPAPRFATGELGAVRIVLLPSPWMRRALLVIVKEPSKVPVPTLMSSPVAAAWLIAYWIVAQDEALQSPESVPPIMTFLVVASALATPMMSIATTATSAMAIERGRESFAPGVSMTSPSYPKYLIGAFSP